MRQVRSQILFAIFAGLSLFLLGNCGENDGTGSAEMYAGPGSAYMLQLGTNKSFAISRASTPFSASDLTVTGTYQSLASGFASMTVVAVVGSGGPSAGDTLYAVRLKNKLALTRPLNSSGSGNIIPLVGFGVCPSVDLSGIWITTKALGSELADNTTGAYSGLFTSAATSGVTSFPGAYALTNSFPSAATSSPGTGTCAGGAAITNSNAHVWTSPYGGLASNMGGKEFLGVPTSSITLSNLNGTYVGFYYDGVTNITTPVLSGVSGGATISIYSLSGSQIINNTQPASSTADITITSAADTPSTGFFQGTIQDNGGLTTGNIVCGVGTFDKSVIVCVGQAPSDNTKFVNLTLVPK